MTALPNPFELGPVASTGGPQRAPAAVALNQHETAGPFDGPDLPLGELIARGFDVDGFLNDIEPLPAFLLNPSPEYLRANEMIPMLAVLAGH